MSNDFNDFIGKYNDNSRRMGPSQFKNMNSRFINLYNVNIRQKIGRLPKINNTRQDVTSCLDLLNAIHEYRKYPTKELFLNRYPDFLHQSDYVDLLWKKFDDSTSDDMYELVDKMLKEIDEALGGGY
jgi:hypothetical protein